MIRAAIRAYLVTVAVGLGIVTCAYIAFGYARFLDRRVEWRGEPDAATVAEMVEHLRR